MDNSNITNLINIERNIEAEIPFMDIVNLFIAVDLERISDVT